jgi:hypothetical protein
MREKTTIRLTVAILASMLFLCSCEGQNLYQKLGLVPKKELILPANVSESVPAGSTIDIAKAMYPTSSLISFNVTTPDDFTGTMIRKQTDDEMEDFVEILSASCYGDEEKEAFFQTQISDQDIADAMRGTFQVFFKLGDGLRNIIKESINACISQGSQKLQDTIGTVIDGIFSPLSSVENKETFTWGEYVGMQLLTDTVGSLFSGLEECGDSLHDYFQETSIDLSSSDIREQIKKMSKDVLGTIGITVVAHMLDVLSVSDQISRSTKGLQGISVKGLTDLIEVILDEVGT